MFEESLQIFSDETKELLLIAEQALLNFDDLNDSNESVGDLFRTFHTIKGAAGLFGFDDIVEFTHVVENLLGKIRDSVIKIDDDMVSLFLACRDHLDELVENSLNGRNNLNKGLLKVDTELVSQLNTYLGISSESIELVTDVISLSKNEDERNNGFSSENWHISLRFDPDVLRNGMDPVSFITYLDKVGKVTNLILIEDSIPSWRDFDPESSYLGFEIELFAPNADLQNIQDVFEFVLEDSNISILTPHSNLYEYVKLFSDLPEDVTRIGDILISCGALTDSEKDDVLVAYKQFNKRTNSVNASNIIISPGTKKIENISDNNKIVNSGLNKQSFINKNKKTKSQQTIRVNTHKLECLVDLVGELVISSANSDLNARMLGNATLNEAMETLLRLVEDVRDTVLGFRMVQIGETFNRYKRVVREVSRDMGKEIELIINGAETELDKTLIEKISDPLMHLVRNAIDHGIGLPEKRIKSGKSAKGTITLGAFHDSGSIVIQIKDDGAGLNKNKILKKAIEKGLVQDNQQLTNQEIYMFIFEAGFSTAEKVSNISGRGVGMDVVRRNIESLRGHIEIESEEGNGTTISIRLPLTLAIIDGFQVRVGDVKYIVPVNMIEECIELDNSLHVQDEQTNFFNLRGGVLPYMHLNDLFDVADTDTNHRKNIVVVNFAGNKAGFVVDELLGEHQTVIKPMGSVFKNLKGISGATILGSGEVAMVIDIPEMINRVVNKKSIQSTTYVAH